ncbi:hypothetical protein F0562_014846 [Nyssa sinensis]|uniref:Uncharacterized protein n=1 Tax=Nyssa sinensis TaxID=561372 RepID=A0A5J4ZQ17_9ASTE|nr:hypothetical protein F0562_014846 [Nyssa sinensis]
MFNALSGMGGGGQLKQSVANNANTALYTTFAVFGFLGGGIYNILGPHLTLFAGCSTYVLYAGSFLYYNHHPEQTFVIILGALLGIGTDLLWACQGAIITSYPPSDRKGTYISLFWSIFNMGGVIGGLIPFILNYNRSKAGSVNDGTYIRFMVFMAIVPAAWASNFFYTYQFNHVNGDLFTLRTRGLNNMFYWGAQMLGSVGIGYIMDFSFKSRRTRGLVGIGIVSLLATAIWGGGLANQLGYSRHKPPHELDFKDSSSDFAGPFVLYFSYGLLDAMFQSMVYWVIGALADDSEILSRYVGFYEGVQSLGGAVAWQVDSHNVSLLSELVVNCYPLLAVLVLLAVKDENKAEEGASKEAALPPVNSASTFDNTSGLSKST